MQVMQLGLVFMNFYALGISFDAMPTKGIIDPSRSKAVSSLSSSGKDGKTGLATVARNYLGEIIAGHSSSCSSVSVRSAEASVLVEQSLMDNTRKEEEGTIYVGCCEKNSFWCEEEENLVSVSSIRIICNRN